MLENVARNGGICWKMLACMVMWAGYVDQGGSNMVDVICCDMLMFDMVEGGVWEVVIC